MHDHTLTVPTVQEIKEARAAAGLTQLQAAELAGYGSQVRWAEIETGKKKMDPVRWRYWRHVAGLERIPYRAAHRRT